MRGMHVIPSPCALLFGGFLHEFAQLSKVKTFTSFPSTCMLQKQIEKQKKG